MLAGPTPPHGNSIAREAEFLLRIPELRPDVVVLGSITEAEKRWLYRHAALVLYPSTVEGFGLVPFEAAQHGVPTLATRRGSLDEVLPADIPVLDGFEVSDGADRAWKLLHDSTAAKALTCALQERSRSFTWDLTAQRLIGLFHEALRQPRGQFAGLEGIGPRPVENVPQPHASSSLTLGSQAFETLFQTIVTRPSLKGLLSPNGSRRQRLARNAIDQVRRWLR